MSFRFFKYDFCTMEFPELPNFLLKLTGKFQIYERDSMHAKGWSGANLITKGYTRKWINLN